MTATHSLLRALIELKRCLRHMDIDPDAVDICMPAEARVRIGDLMADHMSAAWDPNPKKGVPISRLLGFRFGE